MLKIAVLCIGSLSICDSTYDQARHVAKEVRRVLDVKRIKTRKRIIQRLSRAKEQRLIQVAYRDKGARGLLIKILFQTRARLSEFATMHVEDFFLDETMILPAWAFRRS